MTAFLDWISFVLRELEILHEKSGRIVDQVMVSHLDAAAFMARRNWDGGSFRVKCSFGVVELVPVHACPIGVFHIPASQLKHGPGGSGRRGPCDADCLKCKAERCDRDVSLLNRRIEIINPCKVASRKVEIDGMKLRDSIEVEIDGVKLRDLIEINILANHESSIGRDGRAVFTLTQRVAVSTYWSAKLHAKVVAGTERDRNHVLVDLQDEP